VQITSVAKSIEDFQHLVQLLEALGLSKGVTRENENLLSKEFFPSQIKLDLFYRKKKRADADLALIVSNPDAAFEIVKKLGFHILDDEDGLRPSLEFRSFTLQLPGKTRVAIFGLKVIENTYDYEHLALEGNLTAADKSFAIVVSRFNSFITERLLAGAIDGLLRCGADRKKWFEIVRVPGAFEIPSAARALAETKKYDAIICLGCLIRGDTAHYDVIVNEVTRGVGQSAQETGVPHAFGVLTCDTLEQAIDRAGLKMGNKGFEAALAAIEMANLTRSISEQQKQIPFDKLRAGSRSARNDKKISRTKPKSKFKPKRK